MGERSLSEALPRRSAVALAGPLALVGSALGWTATSAPASLLGALVLGTVGALVGAALVGALRAQRVEVRVGAADEVGAVVHATGVAGLADLSAYVGRTVGAGVKGQALALRHEACDLPQLFVDGLHIVPHVDGTVAIGSTSESVWHEDGPDAQLDGLLTRAVAAVPVLAGAEVVARWAGVRPRAASRAARLAKSGLFAAPLAAFDWLWDRAAWAVVGYGYRPFRALAWLVGLSLVSAFLAMMAWNEGSMAPNNDLIAASQGWQDILSRDCLPDPVPGCLANPAAEWNGVTGPGVDWESFHPLAYGADVVIPVLELGQTRSWSPSKDRGPWGHALWWARCAG